MLASRLANAARRATARTARASSSAPASAPLRRAQALATRRRSSRSSASRSASSSNDADAEALREAGVRRVYTPKDFDLSRIMDEIVDVVSESAPVS